jgi:hypothetical protein
MQNNLSDLNPTHEDMVEQFKKDARERKADAYLLAIARDGESPARSIYFYDNAIDAATGYEAYQDWGFAKEFLTVTLYEPTGRVHEKVLKRPRGGECVFVRDDYIEATVIFNKAKEGIPRGSYNQLVFEFAKLFSKDNQRFDHERFLAHTGYTGEITDGY